MSKRVEIEQKFYCTNNKKLTNLITENGLVKSSEKYESDEYFTDINSVYIKNRTCLRIRNVDNKYLELTFKGKSKDFSNNYAKVENNINLSLADYDSIVGLLYSLGYFSYSIVNKKRITYSKRVDDYEYNVMVDEIKDIGNFVEFELLYYKEDKDIEFLQKKLNEFVNRFEIMNFESANLPYRDFVANRTYINVLPQEKLSAILFDLDGTLIDSEKKFFESFRHVIFSKYNYNISYEEYEENELKKNENLLLYLKSNGIIASYEVDDKIMEKIYLEYEKKFRDLLNENDVSLNFELLKQLKSKGLRLALVSTSRKKFIDMLLTKLNIQDLFEVVISREDVKNLKPESDAYIMALEKLNILSTNCIAFEDSERGIRASKSANIKTIQVNDFIKNTAQNTEISEKLSRILLAIINFIGE